MPNWSDYPYNPKSYAGFKFQGTNEPMPSPRPKAPTGLGTCDFHHCKICKKPVEHAPHGGFCNKPDCSICKKWLEDQCAKKKKFEEWRGPVTGRHYTGIIMDDLTEEEQMARCNYACRTCHDPNCSIRNKSKKEVNMCEDETKEFEYQNLYEVTTTYGADRDKVIVKRTDVVAENDKRALMQAADDVDEGWDMDYVEQHVHQRCPVRVKRKPREILATK